MTLQFWISADWSRGKAKIYTVMKPAIVSPLCRSFPALASTLRVASSTGTISPHGRLQK
jgi:hypothetical protein